MVKRPLRILVIVVLSIAALLTLFFIKRTADILYVRQHWKVIKQPADSTAWVHFDWGSDSISGRRVEKSAMFITIKMDDMPNKYYCQFDLGSNTQLYENNLKPYLHHYPAFARKVKMHRHQSYLDNLEIELGGQRIHADKVELMKDYGDQIENEKEVQADTTNAYQAGTIGADICAGRVLIIDYPRQRLCVTDSVPLVYRRCSFYDCSINILGYVIIPVRVHGRIYQVLFDTGSSMFELLTYTGEIDEFSTEPNDDSLVINAWRKKRKIVGRPMKDAISFAGHSYLNTRIYADSTSGAELIFLRQLLHMDITTGNALFLNNTVIIDFKHRKLAVI